MQSPSPSTSQQPSSQGSPSNFSIADRLEIYACVRIAKHSAGVRDDTLSSRVYDLACTFMTDNNLTRLPSIQTVRNTLATVKETGSIEPRKRSGRPHKVGAEEAQHLLQSTRRIARELGPEISVSNKFVHRVAQAQKMRFYRTILGQKLNPLSIQRRKAFADEMHRRIGRQQIDINNVCWTDECMVGTGHSSNRQNDGFWRIQGELDVDAMLKERVFQGPNVHMFVLVHSRIGVVGPYFIEDIDCPEDARKTLTATRYVALLRDTVVPELRNRLGEDFRTCWFQQDGATAHTAKVSLDYLTSVFGDRLISNKTEFIWPPYSPDMSPLDYWFWSSMRKIIGDENPQNVEEIKLAACMACGSITADQVKKAIGDFPIRVMALQEANGHHFEYGLKKFKRQRNLPVTCPHCDQEHQCDCETCDEICIASIMANMGDIFDD